MVCKKCDLYKYVENQVEPRGTDNPDIYFVGEAPGKQEDKEGKPFVGKSGKYLDSVCEDIGISEENARWFNVIKCIPWKDPEKQNTNRKPYKSEIKKCHTNLVQDILRTSPDVIVPLGGTAIEYFIDNHIFPHQDKYSGVTAERGNDYTFKMNDSEFILVPTYHPAYILRSGKGGDKADEFIGDLRKAKKAVDKGIDEGYADVEVEVAKNYQDFKEFYINELKNADVISYDIESNYNYPLSKDSQVVGFSMASNSNKGVYVVFESLEYNMPKKDKERIGNLLKKAIFPNNRVIIHNAKMEIPFTLKWLDYEIDDFEDTMMQARVLLGGQTGAGLKKQAEKLGYSDWSQDLEKFRGILLELYKRLKMTYAGNPREEYEKLSEVKSLVELREYMESQDDFPDYMNNRQESLYDALGDMIELLKSYYEDDYDEIENILVDKLLERISLDLGDKGKPESYAWVPEKIITEYGALDSTVPIELYEHNLEQMDEMGEELGVDFHKGYEYYKQHIFAAYKLELNGINWGSEVVKRELNDLMPEALNAHEELIRSDLIKYDEVFEENKEDFEEYLFNHSPGGLVNELVKNDKVEDYEFGDNGYLNVELSDDEEDEEKVLEIGEGDVFEYVDLEPFKDVYDSYLDERIDNLKAQEDKVGTEKLKPILNPRSTGKGFREIVGKCIITDKIKLVKFYKELKALTEGKNFDIDEFNDDKRSIEERKFLRKVIDLKENEDDYEGEELVEEFSGAFSKFKGNHMTKQLYSLMKDSLEWELDSLEEAGILDIYDCYILSGVDVDNPETWDENFKWLYNFRVYKKLAKMYSTYIKGSVGRGSVWVVDKEKFRGGDKFVPRKRTYYENQDLNDGELAEDETYMFQQEFGVCTTNTGRWSSGFHTLPWQSAPQRFLTSRFEGGTIAMPDFSQQEVRCLAAMANEEKMLEDYRGGMDAHKATAAGIFNKEPEEVETSERRFAKGATFSITYGKGRESFADDFCGGDIERANEIFDDYFESYPKILDYINEKHNEYDRAGKVTLPSGRYINIETYGGYDKDKPYRQAQNYPVQGFSSDLVGSVLYKIVNFIEESGYKSKVFGFVHDSIEIDIHPEELLELAEKIVEYMNVYPDEEFNVPAKAELEWGSSFGEEIEVPQFWVNNKYTQGKFIMEGWEEEIDRLVNNWKKADAFKRIDMKTIDKEEHYISMDELFIEKRAYTKYAGRTRYEAKKRVIIEK